MLTVEAPSMNPGDWKDAREFCLATIKEVYGIEYNSEWHQDLDAMLGSGNVYLPENDGWFLLVRNETGDVVACAGLRALSSRPGLYDQLKHRWPEYAKVGALWRSYVRADHRGVGIGRMMKQRRIEKARELGYSHLYLHASRANPVAVTFGEKFGFKPFQEDKDGTVHMEMSL